MLILNVLLTLKGSNLLVYSNSCIHLWLSGPGLHTKLLCTFVAQRYPACVLNSCAHKCISPNTRPTIDYIEVITVSCSIVQIKVH